MAASLTLVSVVQITSREEQEGEGRVERAERVPDAALLRPGRHTPARPATAQGQQGRPFRLLHRLSPHWINEVGWSFGQSVLTVIVLLCICCCCFSAQNK